MKISAQQYALSLYESIKEKTEKNEVKNILHNFVALLGKNNNLSKEKEIIEIFDNIWSTGNGELKAELISARKLNKEAHEEIVNYLQEKTGAKKIILKEDTDENILGGFILKYNNKIINGSLKSSLEELAVQLEG
jgi:F-type H+-transporting ATPase subunit delta